MNEPRQTTEYDLCPEPVGENFYQTGNTHMPKNHRGLIAFLLVVIILLGSVVGFLGMMNIRLFRALDEISAQSTVPMRFDDEGNTVPSTPLMVDGAAGTPVLGLSGYILSSFDQMVYRLPQGFYILSAEGDAQVQGILPGDVLVKVGGVSVTDIEALKSLVQSCRVGERVSLEIVRSGKEHIFSVIVGEAK